MEISYRVLTQIDEFNSIGLEDLYVLNDIFNKQQEFHFNLKSYDSERFLNYSLRDVKDYIDTCDCCFIYIALDGDKVVGFIHLLGYDNEVSIEDLFVDEGYRSIGIGNTLMKKALEWFEGIDSDLIRVHVTKGNEKALDFYARYDLVMDGYTLRKRCR